MEFIKISKDRYMVKDSNNRIVNEETKLKLEKKELALKDIKGCECQAETTEKIKKIDEKLGKIKNAKSIKPDVVEETTTTAE